MTVIGEGVTNPENAEDIICAWPQRAPQVLAVGTWQITKGGAVTTTTMDDGWRRDGDTPSVISATTAAVTPG